MDQIKLEEERSKAILEKLREVKSSFDNKIDVAWISEGPVLACTGPLAEVLINALSVVPSDALILLIQSATFCEDITDDCDSIN